MSREIKVNFYDMNEYQKLLVSKLFYHSNEKEAKAFPFYLYAGDIRQYMAPLAHTMAFGHQGLERAIDSLKIRSMEDPHNLDIERITDALHFKMLIQDKMNEEKSAKTEYEQLAKKANSLGYPGVAAELQAIGKVESGHYARLESIKRRLGK